MPLGGNSQALRVKSPIMMGGSNLGVWFLALSLPSLGVTAQCWSTSRFDELGRRAPMDLSWLENIVPQ